MEDSDPRQAYKAERAKEEALAQGLLDMIADKVKGTDWEVPNSTMKDILIVMTSVDDDLDHCTLWINTGSWTTAEGMARRVIRDVEARDKAFTDRISRGD